MGGKSGQEGKVTLRRRLNTFDVTNLVVGSIIGADVYVATGIAARLVGPSSLLVWILAGIMAMVIAMSFAYCVMLVPRVGGPYAYVKKAGTPFLGFMVGWALLLAEWFSLAVFPVAFVQYAVSFFSDVGSAGTVALKGLFILLILGTNLLGIKAAGRANDALTIIKLSPLLLLIIGGLVFIFVNPGDVGGNLAPFFTGGVSSFGSALVLVFWAYAGFELSTLPADAVERPERTIPKAIVMGMIIVITFYLLTNLVVVSSLSESLLASSSTPLLDTAHALFDPIHLIASAVVLIVGVGALFSIMGADESGTIGTTRLAYAMSIDGLLPHAFARTSKRGAPYIALLVLCLTAFVASVIGGLTALINSSVFLLAFVYLCTCLSAIVLERQDPQLSAGLRWKLPIHVLGAVFSLLLMLLVDPMEILISLVILAVGVPVYVFFSPRQEIAEARAIFHSTEETLKRAAAQRTRFLAHPLHHIRMYVHSKREIEPAFEIDGKRHE